MSKVTCYYCREEINYGAIICPHCRSHINPGGGPDNRTDAQRNASITDGVSGEQFFVILLISVAVSVTWVYFGDWVKWAFGAAFSVIEFLGLIIYWIVISIVQFATWVVTQIDWLLQLLL